MTQRFSPRFLRSLILAAAFGLLAIGIFGARKYALGLGNTTFPEWDPDVLLHLRRIDQVIGSGGSVPINGTDYYAAFPRPYPYPYAPFLDYLAMNVVWLFHTLFPSPDLHVSNIVGWIPPAFGAILVFSLFLWIKERTNNTALASCITFMLITSETFGYFFSYHVIDHHFLEAFFLWTWSLTGVSYVSRKGPESGLQILGGILLLCLLTGWTGMTRIAFLLALFAGFAQLGKISWAERFCDYVSTTYILAGGLAALLVLKSDTHGFNPMIFSWFQPLLLISLGCGLKGWLWSSRQDRIFSRWGLVGIGMVGLFFFFWQDIIHQAVEFVVAGHPFFDTIAENAPIVTIQGSIFTAKEFFAKLSLSILLFPLGFFLASKGSLKKEGVIVNLIGFGIFALGCYKVRYMRWIPMFMAFWHGEVLYAAFQAVYRRISTYSLRKKLATVLLILGPAVWGYIGLAYEAQNREGREYAANFINAMFWMQKNTPDPGGYYDNKLPDYGVITFWDLGNALAYYGRRPPVTSNLIIGMDHMTHIFASKSEDEVYQRCLEIKAKYWIVTTPQPTLYEKVLPQLLAGRFDGGSIPLSQPKINWDDLPPINYTDTINGKLFRNVGLGKGQESGFSHFRAVYISQFIVDSGYPWMKIFEVVPGAEITGIAPANTSVSCSLDMTFPFLRKSSFFRSRTMSNAEGKFSMRVPYPTTNVSGGIHTGAAYSLIASASNQLYQASLTVPLTAVQSGSPIPCSLAVVPH